MAILKLDCNGHRIVFVDCCSLLGIVFFWPPTDDGALFAGRGVR
jgi:hypothetical protein